MVDLNVGCPVQADDIALISSNVPFMQSLINICAQYSKRWKFKFSPVKSLVMKFTKHTMHINLRLDNNIIPELKTLNHVGIILENGFNTTERSIAA
jgi:hypothetical protein